MHYRTVFHTIGNMLIVEALVMLIPMVLAVFFREAAAWTGFAAAILVTSLAGLLLTRIDRKNEIPLVRDSMVIVALSWICISFFGAIPYYVSGELPVFVDAFFETMSGFTTTGITTFNDLESVSHSILFWRSFTVWLGGMGVLVFMQAVLPRKGRSGNSLNLMRTESSGPVNGKIVPRARQSAGILYLIYAGLSVINAIALKLAGMDWFDAILTMFGTAGTGGFNIHEASIAYYHNDAISLVTTIFMFLFGVSFSTYFLVITGKAAIAFKNAEVRTYACLCTGASIAIAINITAKYGSFFKALLNSSFAVTAMSSSTGYVLQDYDTWPGFSRIVLFFLMFFGGCAGSTACGIKLSRIVILAKMVKADVRKLLSPHSVRSISYEGKPLKEDTIIGVYSYLAVYLAVFVVSVVLVSINDYDMITSISAVAAAINNVGCGFSMVGPNGSFFNFSGFSLIILSFDMLAGRLELFPILMLLYPRTWSRY